MSQQNRNQDRREPSELDKLRDEVLALRAGFANLAQLVLPPQFRGAYCDCGKIACRTVMAVKPRATEVEHKKLCEDCKLPTGWIAAGVVEMSPHDRETARLANELGCYRRS
jgi:hypothetical protein